MSVLAKFKEYHGSKYNAYTAEEADAKLIAVKGGKEGAFIITYSNRYTGAPCAEFYASKRVKNTQRIRFKSEERRKKYIAKWIADEQRYNKRVAEDRAKQKQVGRGVEVGDILSAVWGYDQTNYNYYEVTKLIGKTMVEVREVAQMRIETEWMQGKCAPAVGQYISEPMRKRAKDGYVKISESQRAYRMEPKIVNGAKIYDAGHYTSYA